MPWLWLFPRNTSAKRLASVFRKRESHTWAFASLGGLVTQLPKICTERAVRRTSTYFISCVVAVAYTPVAAFRKAFCL